MAANSWMQHPVGYVLGPNKVPQLNNVWALFTNPVFLWGYTHVVLASLVTAHWSCWPCRRGTEERESEVDAFRRTATISLVSCYRRSSWPCSWAASSVW